MLSFTCRKKNVSVDGYINDPPTYGTNHPQLKRPTRVTRVSHACDTHRANAKTRVA